MGECEDLMDSANMLGTGWKSEEKSKGLHTTSERR